MRGTVQGEGAGEERRRRKRGYGGRQEGRKIGSEKDRKGGGEEWRLGKMEGEGEGRREKLKEKIYETFRGRLNQFNYGEQMIREENNEDFRGESREEGNIEIC